MHDPADRAADGFHEAHVIFALHGDIAHADHHAKRSEEKNQQHGSGKNAADAVVDVAFGFRELLDAVNIGLRKPLAKRRDETFDRPRSAGYAELNKTDAAWKIGELLRSFQRGEDLCIFRAAGRHYGE